MSLRNNFDLLEAAEIIHTNTERFKNSFLHRESSSQKFTPSGFGQLTSKQNLRGGERHLQQSVSLPECPCKLCDLNNVDSNLHGNFSFHPIIVQLFRLGGAKQIPMLASLPECDVGE